MAPRLIIICCLYITAIAAVNTSNTSNTCAPAGYYNGPAVQCAIPGTSVTTLSDTTMVGTIAVTGSSYTTDMACSWTIGPGSPINFRFTSFATEQFYDFVTLYSCTEESCTNKVRIDNVFSGWGEVSNGYYQGVTYVYPALNTDYTSTTGYMRVEWYSDLSDVAPGWTSSWVAPKQCVACPPLYVSTANSTSLADCKSTVYCGASTASTLSFTTTSMALATASFCGDKYVFKHAEGLRVCEARVQVRVYPVFVQTNYNLSMSDVFASALNDACVSTFGVRIAPFGLPADVLRSSELRLSGDCLFYAFSPTAVYCVRRAGVVETLKWQTRSQLAQGIMADVSVHNNFRARTVHDWLSIPGKAATYVLFVSPIDSFSEVQLAVPGLVMFARGAPQFYLKRTLDYTLYLARFSVPENTEFSLNLTSTYVQDNMYEFFRNNAIQTSRVPISSRNTVLEDMDGVILFATAKYTGQHVYVYVAALDVAASVSNTYAVKAVVYDIGTTNSPTTIRDAYEQIVHIGEAAISVKQMQPGVLLISVAIDNVVPTNYQTILINTSTLEIIDGALHPDLTSALAAPFVRLADAVVSQGEVRSCSECRNTTTGLDMSGFFAHGASSVSYSRLMRCEEPGRYLENNVVKKIPTDTCARVARPDITPHAYTAAVFKMTVNCKALQQLEVVLELPAESSIIFGTITYRVSLFSRFLLYAQCVDYTDLQQATLYSTATCVTGCVVVLQQGFFFISGGVRVARIRHQPSMSAASCTWHRSVLLQDGVSSTRVDADLVRNVWQEYSVTTRVIAPKQAILLQVRRDQAVESIAAASGDTQHGVALDALMLVPVLSEGLVSTGSGNTLTTIVYVPSLANLAVLGLETFAYGDDVHDWARVHASVHVVLAGVSAMQCTYVARLVAVDTELRFLQTVTTTGCMLDLPRVPHCHLELPVRLKNTESVVGLQLVPVTGVCNLQRDTAVTVELAPFMKISQCAAQYFLDADTLTCTPCEKVALACGSGQFVRGCPALMHPDVAKECLDCEHPEHSAFSSMTTGCDAWRCFSGYYRAGGACPACTTLLAVGNATCSNTPGRRRLACSEFENERCADCDTKPWYSEWVFVAGRECTWQCQKGYFQSGAGCEKCATLQEAVTTLGLSGTREIGSFYRFRACTGTAQVRAEKCVARDFGYDLHGAYVADGGAFDTDCVLQCDDNSNRHRVRVNATSVGAGNVSVWMAQVCQTCQNDSWPIFANGTYLPRFAFEMSLSCVSTCVSDTGFFATDDTRVCLWCPQNACANGSFWSATDNCTNCQNCTRTRAGGVFTSRGTLNDAHSCQEECATGSFAYDEHTCKQHSVLACTEGVEYRIEGTTSTDAQCGTCADCTGARETVSCSLSGNRQCASCGPIDTWSSEWSASGCNLTCRTATGYTKLYRTTGEVCRKCLPCAVGTTLPAKPSDCTCVPCTDPVPATALYTKGCTWQCPMYHVARYDVESGELVCEYTIKQTSNGAYKLRSVSVVACPPGERLITDARPAAYASLQCERCAVPAGLDAATLNQVWTWDRECNWKCAWNTQKRERRGVYTCETIGYTHATASVHATLHNKQGLNWALVGVLAGCGLVVVVCCLCFLGRALRA